SISQADIPETLPQYQAQLLREALDRLKEEAERKEKADTKEKSGKKGKEVRELTIRDKTSWREIIQTLHEAEAKFRRARKPRKILRAFGDQASTLKQYVPFVPNGTITSPIAAGLNVVLGVKQSHHLC